MSQPQGSPDKSPRVRKVAPKGQRTPDKGAFPSPQSFMAATSVSPSARAQPTTSASKATMTSDEGQSRSQGQQGSGARTMRQPLRLEVSLPEGKRMA